MNEQKRMQPIMIIPTKTVSKKDIAALRANGICVVEATDPSLVRFCEPPPERYSAQEKAAIKLSRYLLSTQNTANIRDRENIGYLYAHYIIQGSPLAAQPVTAVKKAAS